MDHDSWVSSGEWSGQSTRRKKSTEWENQNISLVSWILPLKIFWLSKGDIGVGKTSLIKRYVHHIFGQEWFFFKFHFFLLLAVVNQIVVKNKIKTYKPTIGVDFALKVINWDPNTLIRLQLWDIAGQEYVSWVIYYDSLSYESFIKRIFTSRDIWKGKIWNNDSSLL